MSRKGAYIGGSTVIRLGGIGGPERAKHAEDHSSAAYPRSGGAELTVPKNKPPTKPRMAHPTFKKLRRRVNDVVGWLPHVGAEHRQTTRALARVQRRVEEIAALDYTEDLAAEAAKLSKKFYDLKASLGEAEIARAKFAEREAKRKVEPGEDM